MIVTILYESSSGGPCHTSFSCTGMIHTITAVNYRLFILLIVARHESSSGGPCHISLYYIHTAIRSCLWYSLPRSNSDVNFQSKSVVNPQLHTQYATSHCAQDPLSSQSPLTNVLHQLRLHRRCQPFSTLSFVVISNVAASGTRLSRIYSSEPTSCRTILLPESNQFRYKPSSSHQAWPIGCTQTTHILIGTSLLSHSPPRQLQSKSC